MIYRNDNIKIEDTNVIGSVKDLKEFFKYEIAHQCMSFEIGYEELLYNIPVILELIEKLEKEKEDLIVKVIEHPMGGYVYEKMECE